LEPRQGSHSAVFLALNRNKISLAVDDQTVAGQELVQRLARRADMVICETSAAQTRALRLDYATLAEHNPQLIYGLLTAFGEHGPWANRAASELVVQAASGYPRYLGSVGQEPVRIGADAASRRGGRFYYRACWRRYGIASAAAVGSAWRCPIQRFCQLVDPAS
jgi:crotonobetainyl-CoA:carnitine CoA-transferase CaiB-like acyl-CoA transferase